MSETSIAATIWADLALDACAFVLFALFVLFLFIGYLNTFPSIPYSSLAALPLLGALAATFGANWSADRRAVTSGSPVSR